MRFQTAISDIRRDGTEIIRGYKLSDLIQGKSFVETIFLILKGELPTAPQAKMLDAIFTAGIDHGPATASALTARVSASAKNDLHASVAAGLLGLGGRHGVVIELAMRFFYDNISEADVAGLLQTMKAKKQYAPGYGHKIFEVDPRTQVLFRIAKETGVYGRYAEFAEKVETILNSTASKKLPLNLDGAIAAILCDLGFDAVMGNGIFIIARVPGLVAQIVEEITSGAGIRRLEPEEIEYTGAPERNLI